jgi:N-acetylneuraminate synthase
MHSTVRIGTQQVGAGQPAFIVAEIGINHNGDIAAAKSLVDAAVKAGADAVKFQKRTVPVVFSEAELEKPRDVPRWLLEAAISRGVLPARSVERLQKSDFKDARNGDQKYALEFTAAEYAEIDRYCRSCGIQWSASPWDEYSVDFLAEFNVPFYKVASASLTDDGLLRHIRSKGRPIMLSTGGSTMEQIRHAVDVLGKDDLIVLHCTAAYPKSPSSALASINLRVMDTLRDEFPGVPIGFSSNDGGRIPAFAAAARGAVMLEAHLTLEHAMWGSDQASSMEPVWFRDLVEWVRTFELALGDGVKTVYPDEADVMKKLRRK